MSPRGESWPWLAALALVACGADDPLGRVDDPGPLTRSFAISDVFAPSGHMGDGETLGHIEVDVLQSCKKRPAQARGDCYRFRYTPGPLGWAGVYWVFPANNWGSRPGRAVRGENFKQVRLRAATDRDELLVNFIVGGIADPILPNRDRVYAAHSLRLGRSWTSVRLDIAGQDFDEVIGALAWSLAYPEALDGDESVTLYLDDLVWDTEPVAGDETP